MPTQVTTSATTADVPRTVARPGVTVVYPSHSGEQVSYTIQPHPPTPRPER